jgi:hypothetical protein
LRNHLSTFGTAKTTQYEEFLFKINFGIFSYFIGIPDSGARENRTKGRI